MEYDDGFDITDDAEPGQVDPMRALQMRLVALQRASDLPNATEMFEPDELAKLGERVCQEYGIDLRSREEWERSAQRAMDLAKQVKETKSKPWNGASNVKYPMLTTAALQFAARSYPAIIQGPRIVKVRVLGYDQDGSKALAADRVSMHMSHQFMSELDGWEDEVDTLLHQIPIVGCAFRKTYYDPSAEAGFCSDLVSAFDLVVNNKAKNLDKVPRWTHRFELYPYEVQERQADGRFREDDEDGPKLAQMKSDASDDDKRGKSDDQDDTSSPQMFLEQHRYWDSDGDGVDEPWIVTVHKSSRRVVRLKANYDIEAIKVDGMRGRIVSLPKRKDCGITIIPFIPDPAGGIYAIGFGKLLEAISDVVDTTINQMMDAGTLQNAGGGFIGSGLKLGKTRITVEPGKWQNVDATGGAVRDAIVPLVHPGPSTVLFQLLGMMIEAGKDVASVKDVLTGDAGKTMTATATMALIEQGLKTFTAIFKRIFRAFQREFKVAFEINKRYLDGPRYVALMDDGKAQAAGMGHNGGPPMPQQPVMPDDYRGQMDIMPEADPNVITDMQRLSKAQFLLEQVEKGNPTIDPHKATRRALEAARIERVDDVMMDPNAPPKPGDELQMAMMQADLDLKVAQVEKAKADTAKVALEIDMMMLQAALPPPLVVPEVVSGGQQGMPQPDMTMGGPEQPMPMGGPMQDGDPMAGMPAEQAPEQYAEQPVIEGQPMPDAGIDPFGGQPQA